MRAGEINLCATEKQYTDRFLLAAKENMSRANVNECTQTPTAGYLSFHPMAQCVVHALKGLACRAPVLLAQAEVIKT